MGFFTDLIIPLGTQIIGGVIEAQGAEEQTQSIEEGARRQAAIEGKNREFQRRLFEGQIERQQPFLEAGRLALPEFMESISNRGDVSQLPATQIQSEAITKFLGDQAPEYIKQRSQQNLEAVEAERQKGRLSNLVNFGLGGVGAEAGSRASLGTSLGGSMQRGSIAEQQALQQAAINRQNLRNQMIGSAAGIPALFAAAQGPQTQQFNPFQTLPDLRQSVGGGGFI